MIRKQLHLTIPQKSDKIKQYDRVCICAAENGADTLYFYSVIWKRDKSMKEKYFCTVDKDRLDKRLRTLGQRLNEIQNLIIGGKTSFLPMITDGNGKLSDERIDTLIDKLLSSLEEYKTPEISDGKGGIYTEPMPEEYEPDTPPQIAALYRNFLYCALCILANGDITPVQLRPTFGELLNTAKNANPEVGNIMHNYILSTGDSLDVLGNFVSMALGKDILGQYHDKDPICFGDEEDAGADLDARKKAWESALPDPERFLETFDKYVGARYRKIDCSAFVADTEHMIAVFLYTRGLSAFSFGDEYQRIDSIIDTLCRSIENECRKGVNALKDE